MHHYHYLRLPLHIDSLKHSDILLQDDDSLDNEFDKIFHPEKFDVSQLNPSDTGYVDEERKKYYR